MTSLSEMWPEARLVRRGCLLLLPPKTLLDGCSLSLVARYRNTSTRSSLPCLPTLCRLEQCHSQPLPTCRRPSQAVYVLSSSPRRTPAASCINHAQQCLRGVVSLSLLINRSQLQPEP
ncbi:unnamed protein product [Ectocarpus sp. 13 AM-2016]